MKKLLYFGTWDFLARGLKCYYIFKKNSFSYISGGNLQGLKKKYFKNFSKKVLSALLTFWEYC